MNKKNILILGASGMLGSMVLDYLSKNSSINLSATVKDLGILKEFKKTYKNCKIFYFDAEMSKIDDLKINEFDYIINCIGIIKPLINEEDERSIAKAILINSYFPHLLGTKMGNNSKIIQIATDCVYSGEKGKYKENDLHDPIDVYGKTKSLGEVNKKNFYNIRCSIIGLEQTKKYSLLEWFLKSPKKSELSGYINHIWNGISTYHFARLCEVIIFSNSSIPGNLNFIPANIVSKYQLLTYFKKSFGRKDISVQKIKASFEINRSLSTQHKEIVKRLWKEMGYSQIPSVEMLVKELSEYEYRI